MATIQKMRGQIKGALARGDYEGALSLAQHIRRYYPDDAETTELIGQIHLENGRFAEARKAFESALEVDPENVVAHAALAIVAEEEGDPGKALERFHRAFNIDNSNKGIAGEIRRLHSQLGRAGQANPGSSEYAVGRRLFKERKYEEAVRIFDVALRVAPTPESALGLVQAQWLAGRPLEAEATAKLVFAGHPNCLRALAIAAAAAFSRGDAGALSLLSRTGALNPGNAVARSVFQKAGLSFPTTVEMVDLPEKDDREGSWPVNAGEQEGAVTVSVDEEAVAAADSPTVPEAEEPPDVRPPSREDVKLVFDDLPLYGAIAELASASASARGAGVSSATDSGGSGQALLAGTDFLGAGTRAVTRPIEFRGERWGKNPGRAAQVGRRGDAALHLSFADFYRSRGHVDAALEEYQTALRLDATTAATVGEAALAAAEADPTNVRARWLVADCLATEGQLLSAVEQYLSVLKGHRRA